MDKWGEKDRQYIIKRCLHLPFFLFPLGKRKSGEKIFMETKQEKNILLELANTWYNQTSPENKVFPK